MKIEHFKYIMEVHFFHQGPSIIKVIHMTLESRGLIKAFWSEPMGICETKYLYSKPISFCQTAVQVEFWQKSDLWLDT